MRAFIIRPFGTKNDINFDEVESQLIDPALNRLGVSGRTTMEIRRQGNIRLDMFQRLLTADLIVADISIQNANVYYELGVRQALRGKHTFLIHAQGAGLKTEDVPFDIKTDRYLSYDGINPAVSVDDLYEGLLQTINSEQVDSPIFQMLPDLVEQDRARFLPIPRDYREEVERANRNGEPGDLELLATEALGFEWAIEGLRLVGRAQFDLKALEGARETWEAVRQQEPMDQEANTVLGTIFQRLGDLVSSDQALKRVLDRRETSRKGRAEARSLLGRNAKTNWTEDWRQADSQAERQRRALISPYLDDSLEAYRAAFDEDLNHSYSVLNTLALLTIQTKLAEILPDVWVERFDDDERAERELEAKEEQIRKLSDVAELSVKATAERLQREQLTDVWAEISQADLLLLTSHKPNRVANAYRRALANAPAFIVDALRRQLSLYEELGLLAETVAAVLNVLTPVIANTGADVAKDAGSILLFTGHMIDSPDRAQPRFPAGKIEKAREKIAEAVAAEQALSGGVAYGVAGCANGGDIIFHQVCEALHIPTNILLAVPRELYLRESVAPAGPHWIEEFNRLVKTHPVRVLGDSLELPRWLREKPYYDVWQRNNLWNLHTALAATGGENVKLIALWNGAVGDGPGGTEDMVAKARERGAKTIILDPKDL